MSVSQKMAEDARLRILQSLRRQTDNRLVDRMMVYELQAWGFRRSIEWVQTQMRELAELGAVHIIADTEGGLVVELTRLGARHLERTAVVTGVLRPEVGEG